MFLTYDNDKRFESENLQNIIMRYEFCNIKSKYPQKLIYKILDENQKRFTYCYSEWKYELPFRDGEGVETFTTIYHPAQIENHELIKDIEERGYKCWIRKLIIIFHNSIKYINPEYYKKYILKPMLMTKILQLIDKNLDNFKHWVCDIICLKQPCYCENNPVSRYVCYNLYKSSSWYCNF